MPDGQMTLLGTSIIIVAFKSDAHLYEAIQSVLEQTCQELEIIVVGDIDPKLHLEDDSACSDPRITHVIDVNGRSLATSMNQGIRKSRGENIAFLNANDRYHSKKLEEHSTFLEAYPDIGATFDWCFDIDQAGKLISFSNSPHHSSLSEILLVAPPPFSSVVVRRDWLFEVNLLDEECGLGDFYLDCIIRLFLAGCCFARVEKGLTYLRRCHMRSSRDLATELESRLATLERMFADPRCSDDLWAIREKIYARAYLEWSYLAFAQNETRFGQMAIRQSIQLDRSILDMKASQYLEFVILRCISDVHDHEPRLRAILRQLPPELAWITQFDDQAVALGFYFRGVDAAIWGKLDESRELLNEASTLGMYIDRSMYYELMDQLLEYETLFGTSAAEEVLHNVVNSLGELGKRGEKRWLAAVFLVNQAFRIFEASDYTKVPNKVLRAIRANPRHLSNRGVWSIFLRSLVRGRWIQSK